MLKRCYYVQKQKNMHIFHSTEKDLRGFTTTEKDMKKDINRFPTPNYRAPAEDLFDEGAGGASQSAPDTTNENSLWANAQSGEADLAAQQAVRGKQLNVDANTSFDSTYSEASTVDSNEVRQSMAGGAEAVFARNNEQPASLQDFNIRKMIGKGTFGKVFLVEHQVTKKLYAMKCIRKDIILENEQMENI